MVHLEILEHLMKHGRGSWMEGTRTIPTFCSKKAWRHLSIVHELLIGIAGFSTCDL